MVDKDFVVTSDLSQFGPREIEEAKDLLTAYLENNKTHMLSENGVKICFNRHSGEVFLSDEDYNVGVIHDKRHLVEKGNDDYPQVIYKKELVDFLHCNECGGEGDRYEFEDWVTNGDTVEDCCKEYLKEIKGYEEYK